MIVAPAASARSRCAELQPQPDAAAPRAGRHGQAAGEQRLRAGRQREREPDQPILLERAEREAPEPDGGLHQPGRDGVALGELE